MGTGGQRISSAQERQEVRAAQARRAGAVRDTADSTQENTALPQSRAPTFLLQILPDSATCITGGIT